MIKPSIGRVVWYWPSDTEAVAINDSHLPLEERQPFSAQIAFVHDDHMVNLTVTDHNGNNYPRTSVYLAQDDDIVAAGMCQWMPYQKGQAAKTEELEEKIESQELTDSETSDILNGENETTG